MPIGGESTPESSELKRLQRALRDRQRALRRAEQACERIPTLFAMARKAEKDENDVLKEEYGREGQAIHNRLGDARHDLQQCRRDAIKYLRRVSGRHESARWFLEQLERTSPHVSIGVADEILQMLESPSLIELVAGSGKSRVFNTPSSIPADPDSAEDRQEMARVLAELIDELNQNLTWAQAEIKVAAGTLGRLLAAKKVRKGTWRRAQAFLWKFAPKANR